MEVALRVGDGRVRALLGYVATDFQPLASNPDRTGNSLKSSAGGWPFGGLFGRNAQQRDEAAADRSMASSLVLTDVVITRERLGRRPLEIEGQVDPLWLRTGTESSKVQL